MSVSYVLVGFLLQLSVGMMATVALIPPILVDPRFFKTISFWSLLFLVSGLWLQRHSTFYLLPLGQNSQGLYLLFGAVVTLLWLLLLLKNQSPRRWILIGAGLAGLAAVTADSLLYRSELGPRWVQTVLLPLNGLSAALLLGGFLAGMIFGHWFLVNSDIPKRLLVTMSWILASVLLFRILSLGVTLGLYKWFVYPQTSFLGNLVSFQGHGIFFWERVLVGLAIPAVVTGMIWNTARIGSNQSATGIMYVGIAFVFIGELCARYLFLLSRIPL